MMKILQQSVIAGVSALMLTSGAAMALDTGVKAGTSVDVDASFQTATNYTTIEALPENGDVTIAGTVEEVDGEQKFTLKDESGDTIDVNTASTAQVKKGDTVHVSGKIGDEAMGLGEEITSAKVKVTGSAKTHNNAM